MNISADVFCPHCGKRMLLSVDDWESRVGTGAEVPCLRCNAILKFSYNQFKDTPIVSMRTRLSLQASVTVRSVNPETNEIVV